MDIEIKQHCYWCLTEEGISIKARRKNSITFVCTTCRNQQRRTYINKLYKEHPYPPKKLKNVGWSADWLDKSKTSMERISKKYGVIGE